jgi:hypothetical protein
VWMSVWRAFTSFSEDVAGGKSGRADGVLKATS